MSKGWAPLVASFQKLYATGKPDGDPFSNNLIATTADNTYKKVDLPKGDYLMEVTEENVNRWSDKVKFSVT